MDFTKLPKAAVIMAITREREHKDWIDTATNSINESVYPDDKKLFLKVNNPGSLNTTGKCWNDAIQKLEDQKWTLFVADDDFITSDYLLSLVLYGEEMHKQIPNLVSVSSFLTMFSEKNGKMERYEQRELIPTGLWLTEYLKVNPFVEHRARLVDSEYMKRADDNHWELLTAHWQYGYYYRAHPGQISGEKIVGSRPHRRRTKLEFKPKDQDNGKSESGPKINRLSLQTP